MRRRRKGERFCLDYPKGHVGVSVSASPFSQLTGSAVEAVREPWDFRPDRRWNGADMVTVDRDPT